MIAVDTNLLIYAHRARVAEHRAARRAIERAANAATGWGIPLPCIAEFWSVVTHPTAAGRPSTGREAAAFLLALTQSGGAQVWLPGVGFGERLLDLAAARGTTGPRVFDLQIALLAVEHGASELWTHDRNFATVPGLTVRDPLAGNRA